jgi:hypothetical protein
VRLPLASEAFDRRFGSNRAVLTNLYAEQSREGPTDRRLVPRPGLAPVVTLGPGPVRCVVFHQGVRYIVSGTRVYSGSTQIGVIPGFGLIRSAGYDEQLVMVTDGIAYLIGTDVSVITMPDDDLVSDVVVAAGRFIYTIQGSGKFRYSDIADATTIGDLNFASAESDPDNIVSAETLGDDIIFYGQNTTEWHSPTSDIDIPFIRNGGRRYDKGSAAQFTAVKIDNTIFWVGTAQQGADLQVYRAAAVPVAISNEGIEAALAACADITQASAVAIVSTGHSFYVLNIPGVGTYAYDVKTGLWGNWESFGQTTFRVQCGADGVYGDAINGKLWTIDPDRRTDGDDTIIYLASSFLAVPEGTYRLNGLRLNLKTGVGAPDGNPVVEFRYAETGGEDWSTWREASIGSPGNHPTVIWRQLGMIKPPGRSLEFRFSGGADFVPHEVTADLVKGSDRL